MFLTVVRTTAQGPEYCFSSSREGKMRSEFHRLFFVCLTVCSSYFNPPDILVQYLYVGGNLCVCLEYVYESVT